LTGGGIENYWGEEDSSDYYANSGGGIFESGGKSILKKEEFPKRRRPKGGDLPRDWVSKKKDEIGLAAQSQTLCFQKCRRSQDKKGKVIRVGREILCGGTKREQTTHQERGAYAYIDILATEREETSRRKKEKIFYERREF